MNNDQGITYYPIYLNIKCRKCVVVGGGQVALRKVKILLEHGADIEVISPALCPALVDLVEGGEIRALNREYQEGDLKGAFITIAATDNSDINQRVVAEARTGAVLVNVVDDAANCDFIVPSYLRRGDITIAVSSSGKSPSLARKIRSKLEIELVKEYAILTDLISEVRAELKQKGIKINADGWQEAIELDSLLNLLKTGSREEAKTTLLANLKINQH